MNLALIGMALAGFVLIVTLVLVLRGAGVENAPLMVLGSGIVAGVAVVRLPS